MKDVLRWSLIGVILGITGCEVFVGALTWWGLLLLLVWIAALADKPGSIWRVKVTIGRRSWSREWRR